MTLRVSGAFAIVNGGASSTVPGCGGDIIGLGTGLITGTGSLEASGAPVVDAAATGGNNFETDKEVKAKIIRAAIAMPDALLKYSLNPLVAGLDDIIEL